MKSRRHDERRERGASRAQVVPRPESADEEESHERDPEEDRVGRVHDREDEGGRGGRGDSSRCRESQRREREGESRRHEQLDGRGRGQREEGVGASVAGREAGEDDLRGARGAGGPRPPEEGPACLVRDDDGERC
jgi:hypothetical protein